MLDVVVVGQCSCFGSFTDMVVLYCFHFTSLHFMVCVAVIVVCSSFQYKCPE